MTAMLADVSKLSRVVLDSVETVLLPTFDSIGNTVQLA